MAKLYLIRTNLENFSGPMTVAEMKVLHARIQFGPADEISGNCGPWVPLSNPSLLHKHYPEVARILGDVSKSWGVSDHSEEAFFVNEETSRIKNKKLKVTTLALTFIVIALLAFISAIYVAMMGAQNNRSLSKILSPVSEVTARDFQGLYDRGELAQLDQLIESRLENIVERANSDRRLEQIWLPFLRWYAFQHEGMIPGFPLKSLRGVVSGAAPGDCSLKQWRKRWRASLRQWNQLIHERKLVRSHWARMLAWDPYWIRRRSFSAWLGNQNYYLGCLMMAERALDELPSDGSLVSVSSDWHQVGYNQIKQRLTVILDIARDGQSPESGGVEGSNELSSWTCFEQAKDFKALQKCKELSSNQVSSQDSFATYTEERFAWNAARLLMLGPLSPEVLLQLETLGKKANRADFYTLFDYRAEQRLLKLFSKSSPGEKVFEKLNERVKLEFPDVDLMR